MIPVKQSEFTTKQENITNDSKTVASSSSTTTSWSRLKDPRIVRVSRAFGGKDRHSKVCTVRGLRDRRVRLSVPTAIQVYDLQDRLGLNQPSKVVDWLLNVAKHEINELPPLQIPQGLSFSQNMQTSHEIIRASQLAKQGVKISDVVMNSSNDIWGKDTSDQREENWTRNEEEREFQENNQGSYFTTSNNFLSRPNLLLNNISTTPYNPFVKWDPSNLTLSQPQEEHQNFSLAPSGSNQVLVYHQHGTSLQSYLFPSQTSLDFTEKQPHFENSQLSSNSSLTSLIDFTITSNVRPFQFSMAENFLPRTEQNKDEFH